MNSGNMQDFFKGKTVLVTGATGFLAKVFVEKILRIQPEIQKLYLLLRASNSDMAAHRLQNEILEEIDVLVHSAASTKFDDRFDILMGVNTKGALHALNFAKNCQKLKAFVHISTAYVCGNAKYEDGIVREKAFEMGQSLKKTSNLDIHTEMKLLDNKIAELQAMNADENTMKFALKDYGMERANLHGQTHMYSQKQWERCF
ncbi:hypothetical protein KIW84_074469 [Lathyrus oleraceus]|uniref:Fatty acyl-CoA reductase n=1 Tax=Pisum sativum TaxID=3888 RepID=A0A9D4VSX9_PEA|nr:hypothetical protein KIW84_074469 [Pisum sativum]